MKIYINRIPVRGPWGGGTRFVNAVYEFVPKLGHELVTSDFIAPDVILLQALDSDGTCINAEQAIMYKTCVNPNVKIVIRVNENDARKGTNNVDKAWLHYSKFVDGTVFVSQWLMDYFVKKGWACKKNIVMHNGVDANVFCQSSDKIGGDKVNIVSSHWSDNAMKGQDVTEWLDAFVGRHPDKFTFSFIGRTKAKLVNGKFIPPMGAKPLGKELARYDVCINGTRFDPAPNSVIEPIACGLPTYVHCDGGGAVELAGEDHVFHDLHELEFLLLSGKFVNNTTSFASWEIVMKKCIDFLQSV